MMKHTHTLGPWVQGCESIDPEWRIVTTIGGAIIANVNGADEANARLIAAAPDMLDALLSAIEAIEWWQDQHDCCKGATDRHLSKIRAAIAKAKGASA